MALLDKEPEDYARALLAHLGLKRIENIAALAARLSLKIREVDSRGFEGALIRLPNQAKGVIAVKRDIREPGRKNFTALHEIGHFVLPGHGAKECFCKSDEIESWRRNAMREQEIQANRFASELLLPVKEIYSIVNKRKATLYLAKELSAEFQSSLTATVLKCVEATEERCAIVWSVGGNVKWFRANENFKSFIRAGRLEGETLAASIPHQSLCNERDGAVPAEAWLQNHNLRTNATIWEDSQYLPYYNGVLTILTIN